MSLDLVNKMKRGRKKGGINHPTTETMRWCWCCQQYKSFSEFCKDIRKKLGLNRICKTCSSHYYQNYQHNYYLQHKEELLPKHKISARLSQDRKTSV